MNILIIGAAGMVGAKLTKRLIADKALAGKPITGLALTDVIAPAKPEGTAWPVTVGFSAAPACWARASDRRTRAWAAAMLGESARASSIRVPS